MAYRVLLLLISLMIFLGSCNKKAPPEKSAFIFPSATDPVDSLKKIIPKLDAAAEKGTETDKARAAIVRGMYYSMLGSFRTSQQNFALAQKHLQGRPADSLLAKTFMGLGSAAKNLGDYSVALTYYLKALKLYEQQGNHLAEAGVHAGIGQVFQLKEDLPQATMHLNTALTLLKDNRYSLPYLVMLHTLANTYGMRNKLDSALLLDKEGLKISREMKLPGSESTFLDNKANCFMYGGQPDSARIYFYQSLAIDSAQGNKKQMSDTFLNLGILESMQNNSQKSIAYLNRSVALAAETGYRRGEMEAWISLSRAYQKSGNFKSALEAQSRSFSIKDSIMNMKKESALAEWKTIYDSEKKDRSIMVQQASLQQKNLIMTGVIVIALLSLFSLYQANRKYKLRKEKIYQQEIFAQEQRAAIEILSAEERERKRIAEDLHDGIGQTMAAAWLNLQALNDSGAFNEEQSRLVSTTTRLVGDSCGEIRQTSHIMMPNTLIKKGLPAALEVLTHQISETKLAVSLSIDPGFLRLDQTTELVLYRAIQECLNNVIRHSQATELDVSLTVEEKSISVLIEDNGIGFDPGKLNESDGIGMQNIRSRISYLKGSVEWSSRKGKGGGTVVAIHIPYDKQSAA